MPPTDTLPDDHAVIAAAFDAVGSDAGWETFLLLLAKRFRSVSGELGAFTEGPSPSMFTMRTSESFDQAVVDHYREHYAGREPTIPYMLANPGRALSASIIAGSGASSLKAKEILRGRSAFHEFFGPHKLDWAVGIRLPPADDNLPNQFAVTMGVVRPDAAGDFALDELRAMEKFAPLVRRAFDLHLRFAELEMRASEASGAIDVVSDGVLFVDRDAVVSHMNPAAERIVTGGDGLVIQRGRLLANRNEDQARLHRAIFAASTFVEAAQRPGDEFLLARPSGRCPYRMTVAPSPRRKIGFGLIAAGRVIVTVSDPDRRSILPVAELRQRFGLTAAEAEMALALGRGETVSDYAERREITLNTARTLLKRAMAKMDCTRQSQLVAKVLGQGGRPDE